MVLDCWESPGLQTSLSPPQLAFLGVMATEFGVGLPGGGMGTTHTCLTQPPFGADCWETPLLGRYVLPGGPYGGVRIRRVGSYVPHVRRDGLYVTLTLGPSPVAKSAWLN